MPGRNGTQRFDTEAERRRRIVRQCDGMKADDVAAALDLERSAVVGTHAAGSVEAFEEAALGKLRGMTFVADEFNLMFGTELQALLLDVIGVRVRQHHGVDRLPGSAGSF